MYEGPYVRVHGYYAEDGGWIVGEGCEASRISTCVGIADGDDPDLIGFGNDTPTEHGDGDHRHLRGEHHHKPGVV